MHNIGFRYNSRVRILVMLMKVPLYSLYIGVLDCIPTNIFPVVIVIVYVVQALQHEGGNDFHFK